MSTVTDHALLTADLSIFSGRRVFLDTNYFNSYDSQYVIGTIRDALNRAGAILEDNATNSDVIIEARSGGLATDSSATMIGIPALSAPVPLSGGLSTPEVAFYKSERQHALAKFALLAIGRKSRKHVYSSGPLDGKSYDSNYRILFIKWIRTDIPEKHWPRAKADKYQTWFPQFDSKNLPPAETSSTNSVPNPSTNTNPPPNPNTAAL